MEKSKGLVTIPTDLDVVPQTLELMKLWGADAIRDCDGTDFPTELKDADAEIYSTYYTTRKDNAWAEANPEEIQQMYVMTPFYTAESETLEVEVMKGRAGRRRAAEADRLADRRQDQLPLPAHARCPRTDRLRVRDDLAQERMAQGPQRYRMRPGTDGVGGCGPDPGRRFADQTVLRKSASFASKNPCPISGGSVLLYT